MTSRTPAGPTPERADRPAEADPAQTEGTLQASAPEAPAPAEPKPGDLGEQAPAVEPTRPNWSRLAGAETTSADPAEQDAKTGVAAPKRVPLWLVLTLALGGFAADQASKFWAMAALEPGSYRPLIGEFLGFQLVFNSGAAFSLAEGMTWIFTIVAAVVAVVIVRVARNLRSRAWALVLAGLLGGTLGNLFDRLFREPGFGRGYVVDFINYNGYFVGNVADIFIVAAAIGMGVLTFIGIGFDGRRSGERSADDDASGPSDVATPAEAPERSASSPSAAADEPAGAQASSAKTAGPKTADSEPTDSASAAAQTDAAADPPAGETPGERPAESADTTSDEEPITESPAEPRG